MPPEVHREIRRLLMLKAGTEKLASRMRTVNVMSRIEIVEQLMRGRTKGARQVQGRHGSEAPDRCVQDVFLNRAMTEAIVWCLEPPIARFGSLILKEAIVPTPSFP